MGEEVLVRYDRRADGQLCECPSTDVLSLVDFAETDEGVMGCQDERKGKDRRIEEEEEVWATTKKEARQEGRGGGRMDGICWAAGMATRMGTDDGPGVCKYARLHPPLSSMHTFRMLRVQLNGYCDAVWYCKVLFFLLLEKFPQANVQTSEGMSNGPLSRERT